METQVSRGNWFRTIGTYMAVILSLITNKAFWWAIFHGLCGWLYVFYWAFKYTGLEKYIKSLMETVDK